MTKPLRSMVYSQEGTGLIGIYSTSYTSTETDSLGLMWCFGSQLWVSSAVA